MPITTRQLESLIRLAQARAKAELRDMVTEDDALDVVEIMQESLLEAYTTETGEIDFTHHTGSMSLSKQVRPGKPQACPLIAPQRQSVAAPGEGLREAAHKRVRP
jgi:DNA replicative helicase MCM subunit Mcm2 (Cdc46/Mcm family)